MNESQERPSAVTEEHLEFLDELRESGVVNMFGASVYVEREFSFGKRRAYEVLSYWMKTFSDRKGE